MFGIKKKLWNMQIKKIVLRPKNLFEPAPGSGFKVFTTKDNIKSEFLI